MRTKLWHCSSKHVGGYELRPGHDTSAEDVHRCGPDSDVSSELWLRCGECGREVMNGSAWSSVDTNTDVNCECGIQVRNMNVNVEVQVQITKC